MMKKLLSIAFLFFSLVSSAQTIKQKQVESLSDTLQNIWNNIGSASGIVAKVSTISALQSYSGYLSVAYVTDAARGGFFDYSTSSLTDDNGIVFAATGKGSGHWVRRFDKSTGLNVQWYGAVGDGTTNDQPAIAAAITAATVSDGVHQINFPTPASYYRCDGQLDLSATKGLTLKGAGSRIEPTEDTSRIALVYTGTASAFIKAGSSWSLTISGLAIQVSSASFTGDIITLDHSSGRVTYSTSIVNCMVGGRTSTARHAQSCINLRGAVEAFVDLSTFGWADQHIIAAGLTDATSYSNAVTISRNRFSFQNNYSINIYAATQWSILNNVFELQYNSAIAAGITDLWVGGGGSRSNDGVLIQGNGFWDATSGVWIDIYSFGTSIIGNFAVLNGGTTFLQYNAGYNGKISGNRITGTTGSIFITNSTGTVYNLGDDGSNLVNGDVTYNDNPSGFTYPNRTFGTTKVDSLSIKSFGGYRKLGYTDITPSTTTADIGDFLIYNGTDTAQHIIGYKCIDSTGTDTWAVIKSSTGGSTGNYIDNGTSPQAADFNITGTGHAAILSTAQLNLNAGGGAVAGMTLQGSSNPAITLKNGAGTTVGYMPVIVSSNGAFFSNAVPDDIAIRSESNTIRLGQGSGNAELSIGITTKINSLSGNGTGVVAVDNNGELSWSAGGGGTTTNALTFNNSGTGDASGSTFDGSAAKTLSYNSIGAVPTTTTVNGHALSANVTVTQSDVGLGNVDNTSDATKNSATATLTNKRITKRTGTTASSATPTINTDNVDFYSITALAANITSFTTNLSGSPTEGQTLWIAITDNGTPRTLAFGASFEASTVPLPTTTVASTRLDCLFVWNTVSSKWRIVACQ